MPLPPRLSANSTERMEKVVTAADNFVDNGMHPDMALAKAAQEYSLPAGHIPIVVRAFNTGRAVRQLGESDVWSKAAQFPTASAEGVTSYISDISEVKQEKKSSYIDYLTPPNFKEPQYTLPVKEASNGVEEEVKPQTVNPRPINDYYKLAELVDNITDKLERLPANKYAGVKKMAYRCAPDAADFVFKQLESADYHCNKKASAKPDITVGTDNDIVKMFVEMESIKSAFQEIPSPQPLDEDEYTKIAESGCNSLYKKNPNCKILNKPIPSKVKNDKPKEVKEVKEMHGLELANPIIKASDDTSKKNSKGIGFKDIMSGAGKVLKSPFDMVGAIGGAAKGQMGKKWEGLKENKLFGPVVKGLQREYSSRPSGDAIGASEGLQHDLKRLQLRNAVQNLLMDPRFTNSDPKTVIDTFSQLSSLAPRAMANPAVASDFVHRRLMTGPLSYFDTSKLIEMEHNLARIERSARTVYAEDDDED